MQILQLPVKTNVRLDKRGSPLKAYNSLGETAFNVWASQHENGRVVGIATGEKAFHTFLPRPLSLGNAISRFNNTISLGNQ